MTEHKKAGYLKGKLLIAMPGMGDPRFERSVIFICAHDAAGAMGLVVNQALETGESRMLLDQLGVLSSGIRVHHGGPVDRARGFILHSPEYSQSDTVPIIDGFSITGTVEMLRAAAQGRGPKDMIFALGYAGWSAGQLDAELQQNAWLVAEARSDTVFRTPHGELWGRVVREMGIDPAMLSQTGGNA